MKITWVPEAEQDRLDIWEYIAAENPAAARIDALFSHAVSGLASHPYSGRTGRIPGTRELIPHPHYCLIYEFEHETLWILALVHTSRQWPPV
ncbi:hypothetical protein PS3A_40950 [Pseudomonas sp. 3A(2025)]